MYDRILIPTDGSEVAEAAVDHGLDIAEKYGATVHTLYVVDIDAVSLGLGAEQVDRLHQGRLDEMEEIEADAEAATDYVAKRAQERGLDVVEDVDVGCPHAVIAEYAEDTDIDFVVMGSHGHSGAERALLGSVTERVLRSTERPVLVIDVEGSS